MPSLSLSTQLGSAASVRPSASLSMPSAQTSVNTKNGKLAVSGVLTGLSGSEPKTLSATSATPSPSRSVRAARAAGVSNCSNVRNTTSAAMPANLRTLVELMAAWTIA